jgi:FkbM family methyltransferase
MLLLEKITRKIRYSYFILKKRPRVIPLMIYLDLVKNFRLFNSKELNFMLSRNLKKPDIINLWGLKYYFSNETMGIISHMYSTKECIKFEDFLPKNGDIVFDIGASIGVYTLIYSKLVGKKGKVLAFEPNKYAFDLLVKHMKINASKNIIALNKAVWSKNTTIKMKYEDKISLDRVFNKNSNNVYSVKAVTIDNVTKKFSLKKVNLIKIDVEGSEIEVLRGGIKTLREFKPKLIVEVHEWLGIKKHKIERMLKKLNFKLLHEYKVVDGTYEMFFA